MTWGHLEARHLGVTLGRHDRTDDREAALKALLMTSASERPDLIIHVGDLFDVYRPPYPQPRSSHPSLRHLRRPFIFVFIRFAAGPARPPPPVLRRPRCLRPPKSRRRGYLPGGVGFHWVPCHGLLFPALGTGPEVRADCHQ